MMVSTALLFICVLKFIIGKMSFNRVPEDFMKGIFLAPYNFSDPENPSHAEYVHLQLKNDLYFSTLQEISNVEFSFLSPFSKDEWIKVEQMRPCGQETQWFWPYSDSYKKTKGRTLATNQDMKVQLLSCQEWTVQYHNGGRQTKSKYRVEVLQSSTDIFKSQIYPPTLFKTVKDILIN